MRRTTALFSVMLLVIGFSTAWSQQPYTNDKVEYTLELPSSAWRVISEADAAHEHTEFVYGDRLEGYLQIRKEVVDAGTTASELSRRDQDQKFAFLPGFVVQADNRTIYALRFSGLRDKLTRIRNQTDLIARSFKLK